MLVHVARGGGGGGGVGAAALQKALTEGIALVQGLSKILYVLLQQCMIILIVDS